MMRVRVYIDGYNLYYGLIREYRLHWLDLAELSRRLNSGWPVDRVVYCTARAASNAGDPQKAQRQEVYLRAIGVRSRDVEIVYGQYRRHKKYQPLAGCGDSAGCAIQAEVWEEKGSDVNLASRLLHDAHSDRFDKAMVISGDSDLVEPIRLAVSEIHKVVWVFNPRTRVSRELKGVASRYGHLTPGIATRSQLPDPVVSSRGTYSKPAKWKSVHAPRVEVPVLATPCPRVSRTLTIATCRWV